jgi:large subunit ribosomal protein L22e
MICLQKAEPRRDLTLLFVCGLQEKFLHDKIKVNGKTGKLGELVTIERDANSIHVTTKTDMAKRYLKVSARARARCASQSLSRARFATRTRPPSRSPPLRPHAQYLTKKFLKKQQLRDYIRVIAGNKNGYDLRYFNINDEEEEAGAGDK